MPNSELPISGQQTQYLTLAVNAQFEPMSEFRSRLSYDMWYKF